MTREPFDLLTFPLNGKRLIEASAGTGKTFSLAGLYLRLLVEKRLDVRDILVMTFTRAATQELRERIRTRLTGAALLAAHPERAIPGNAEHRIALDLFAGTDEPREPLARRLRAAAARMDDATISTIHGFAQQAAQENAFDSGLPFDRGTQVDDPPVHLEACTDYWRSQILGRPPAQARAFLELWPEPGDMKDDLKEALERPALDIWGPAEDELEALAERARTLWTAEHGALGKLIQAASDHGKLLKSGPLNKAIDAAGGIDALLAGLADGLAGTASGHAVLPAWLADLSTDEGAARCFHKAALNTYRPQDLALVQSLAALAPSARLAALKAALDTTRASIRARKRAGRQFSFADMIESLHAAVTHPERGPDLAGALHRTWRYALVDEFQDTDPLQYQILHAIYSERASPDRDDGALIMIGDPKQAIYAFRGGDVFAYLQAARDADGVYELDTNHRSTRGVLAGIEALFHGPAAATANGEFLVPGIRFHTVKAGRAPDDRAIVKNGKRLPPITAWALPDGASKKDQGQQALLDACVSEICALLGEAAGARVRTDDGTEAPLRPGQIAVLVHTNDQAALVQGALARRGVAAVCLQRASVFDSEQAQDLLYLLRAADRAARPEAVRTALATPLLGLRMADLLALTEDDGRWQAEVSRFQDLHEIWRTRGLLAMLEPLLQTAAPRLLALEDGERRMTNYLQLAELLAQAQTETFGFAGLIQWLAEQMAYPQPDAEVDSQQLKLESDDELVRITTVHRAKGLQFPVVFVPFTPLQPTREPKAPWVFHDRNDRAWLDFGQDGGAHKGIASREVRAESLRLLYVALTRAEDVCYFGWGALNGAQNTALGWLLHAEDGAIPDQITRGLAKWLTPAIALDRLQAFAGRASGAVRVTAPPDVLHTGFRVSPGAPPAGAARDDLPARRPDWSVFSFSRLVAGGRHPAGGSGADDELLEVPPDVSTPVGVTPPPNAMPAVPARIATAIALRGPAFGTAVHQLLEAIDEPTSWPAPDVPPGETERAMAARHLHNAGLPLGDGDDRRALLDAVCGMISRTLHTPLPDIGPLARIPGNRRLVEMEFYLKLGGERVGHVLDVLTASGYPISLAPERATQTLQGLMQGFIDLTVEAGGRYWVVDYKTNDLGTEPRAYQGDALTRAVRYGHYDLQYLIYLVALHRHLAQTLPDYDPAHHLGGAQYLFLRGLDGTSAATGVYVDTPPAGLIATLDDLFATSPGRSALQSASP